jgi:hypothetical protein
MNTKTAKKRADHSVNGPRKIAPREVYHPPSEAPPSTLALLRATWANRKNLTPKEREVIHSLLGHAKKKHLTPAQLTYAIDIGRRVGVGYDDPALDDPKSTANAPPKPKSGPSAQPWGPLPLRPPFRAVAHV